MPVIEEELEEMDAPRATDPPGRIRRYGRLWKPLHKLAGADPRFIAKVPEDIKAKWYDYFIEWHALQLKEELPGYLGFEEHFMNLTNIVWADPEWEFSWEWNPNAVRMLFAATQHKFLGIAGAASTGKSMFGMLWGLTNWILNPEVTKVFITSTTLEDSRGRIWGDLERYWNKFCEFFGGMPELVPGELVSSKGFIRAKILNEKTGVVEKSQKAGIALIAGAKGQDKNSAKKIGFKSNRIILIADELPLLSHDLYKACVNLSSNPDFQFIGIGNPTSKYDPFGSFVDPVDGWISINENSDQWNIKLGGICLRFDGKKSPNVLAGRAVWKNILTLEKWDEYVEKWGEDSMEFWQMVRGFFSPVGAKDAIYCENDFDKYHAKRVVKEWVSVPQRVASLDPAFTHDGDRAVGTFGLVGLAQFDQWGKDVRVTLQVTHQVDYNKQISKDENKAEEVVRLFAADIERLQIHPTNVAMDTSGGGAALVPLLALKIGNKFHQVNFGGAPSDMPVNRSDAKAGDEKFANHVTELWMIGREIMRRCQFAGLTDDIITELCSRTYRLLEKGKSCVESKKQMKNDGKRSPDFADSWVVLVDLCRAFHNLISTEKPVKTPPKKDPIPEEFQWGVKKRRGVVTMTKVLHTGTGTLPMGKNLSR